MTSQIITLNDQYCSNTAEKTQWACVVELASLLPEESLAKLFLSQQRLGWPMPIVRALAKMYSYKIP